MEPEVSGSNRDGLRGRIKDENRMGFRKCSEGGRMHDGNKAASAVRKELLKDYVFTGKLHSGPGKSNGGDAEPEDDPWQ